MKLIILSLSIILAGCSTIYKVKDYSQNEKFISDFNSTINERHIKITLTNDSVIYQGTNAVLLNDTLFFANSNIPKKDYALCKIKSIRYERSKYYPEYTATILLNDMSEFKAVNIKQTPDSSIQFNMLTSVPASKLKEVSYKNSWLGAIIGIPAGVFAGLGIGAFVASGYSNGKDEKKSSSIGTVILFSGPIIGAVLGSVVGYTYTYQFNK